MSVNRLIIMRGSRVAVALLALLLTGLLFTKIYNFLHSPHSTTPNDLDEQTRLAWGRAIGHGLVSYARDHNGFLPPNLEILVPRYVGTDAQISEFRLFHPGQRLRGKVLIASDDVPGRFRAGKRMVLIEKNGDAYLLRPGD